MVFGKFLRHFTAGYSVRPKVWLSAVATALLLVSYLSLASTLVRVSSPDSVAVAAPVHTTPKTTQVVSTTATPTPVGVSTPSAVPACTPSPSVNLSTIPLTTAATGLTNRTDPDALYRIYGNTAEQLRSQIRSCAPGNNGNGGAEYTAVTSYTLSWQYDTLVSDGLCRAVNVKVGVHIQITMPSWEPTAAASTGLVTKWQNFINALSAHEAGHVALDQQYAGQLESDVRNLPAMDCGSLNATVKSVADRDVALLNQANDTYDATTDHGATQGAVLPQ